MQLEDQGIYHLFNRGCNKDLIFQDDRDFLKLMEIIHQSDHSKYLRLIAFSLMPNHYHILARQISEKPLPNWIRYIFNRYTKYYNHRHDRSGTLFESKVKIRKIASDEYLTHIIHYIHNNPTSEKLRQFSSLACLHNHSIVDQEFYNENFDGFFNYLDMFEEWKMMKIECNDTEDFNLS